ncbi:MAG: hypothetical protein AB3N64_07905 [Puniceicoccaceae bacterium]
MRNTFSLPPYFGGRLFHFLIFAIGLAFAFAHQLEAQFKFREPPNRQDPSALEDREGEQVWEQFLYNRHIGSFQMEGELVYRPGRAPSRSYKLELSGTWQRGSELTRVAITNADGKTEVRSILLEEGGAYFIEDREDGCDETVAVESAQLSERIFASLPFTWSDLLMTFLNWKDASYEGPDRYLGRPAHRFVLLNPERQSFPARVVVTIDEDYAALLKADFYDENKARVKRLRIGGFKQFGNEWMFSELTWSNRPQRESVTLRVRSFSLLPQ